MDKETEDYIEKLKKQLAETMQNASIKEMYEIARFAAMTFVSFIFQTYEESYKEKPPSLSKALRKMEMRDVSPYFNYMLKLKYRNDFIALGQFLKIIYLTKKYMPEIFEEVKNRKKANKDDPKDII